MEKIRNTPAEVTAELEEMRAESGVPESKSRAATDATDATDVESGKADAKNNDAKNTDAKDLIDAKDAKDGKGAAPPAQAAESESIPFTRVYVLFSPRYLRATLLSCGLQVHH